MILDPQGRIVLANSGFRTLMPENEKSLLARRASDIPWLKNAVAPGTEHPWVRALTAGESVTDTKFTIPQTEGEPRKAIVSASPILDGQGTARGCLVTFKDVTDLERANADLEAANAELGELNRQIERQNEELKQLASIDPLSGCMNRRSFFESSDPVFLQAQQAAGEVCVLMCDIDKFKVINDTYGHAVGDLVIQQVARILKAALRPSDLLCRYGGEEFCIVLPDINMLQAYVVAERIRFKIEAQAGPGVRTVQGLRVTSSFGLSSIGLGAPDLKALIEQADEALYHSKQTGRNKVTRFDDMMIEKAGTPSDAVVNG
jgi:diguanylate cyclase (GGDEF)-like protein